MLKNNNISYEKFKKEYNEKRLVVKVNSMKACRLIESDLADKKYKPAHYFWVYVSFFLVFILPIYLIFKHWVFSVISIIVGWQLYQACKRSASQFVIENILSDEKFYNYCLEQGGIIIADDNDNNYEKQKEEKQDNVKVKLNEVLNNEHNNKEDRSSYLSIYFGKDEKNGMWFDSLSNIGHLLIAGATNSGKSMFLHSIIINFLHQYNSDELKFILVDPKRVELSFYKDSPYLHQSVIVEPKEALKAMEWCVEEMDKRFDVLAKAGKDNVIEYNKTAEEKMPFIVYIVDSLVDLTVAHPKEVEEAMKSLLTMARAVGIHLICSTSRPCEESIPDLVNANFINRVAFSMATETDSNFFLSKSGAEKLNGKGDMLYSSIDHEDLIRIQAPFISDNEIKDYLKKV